MRLGYQLCLIRRLDHPTISKRYHRRGVRVTTRTLVSIHRILSFLYYYPNVTPSLHVGFLGVILLWVIVTFFSPRGFPRRVNATIFRYLTPLVARYFVYRHRRRNVVLFPTPGRELGKRAVLQR